MATSKPFEEIATRLRSSLRGDPGRLEEDFRRNVGEAISAALERMDLVTREEFDVQSEVLARARRRIAELEAQVTALEDEVGARAADKPGTGDGPV